MGRDTDQSENANQCRDVEKDRCRGHPRAIAWPRDASNGGDEGRYWDLCIRRCGTGWMKKSLTAAINGLFSFFADDVDMDVTRVNLFELAEKRLAWTAQRQSVLAANIANADTPGFQARDVQSFQAVMAGANGIEPLLTNPMHLPGTAGSGLASTISDPPRGRAIDGNSVSLDEQLTKVADTETTQGLVATIWKKYRTLFAIALGRSN